MLKNHEENKAIELLKQNKIIILPTDTIYGLSAVYSLENEKQINKIKKADLNKRLIILISSLDQLKDLDVIDQTDKELLLSDQPTTVIFKTKDSSVAVRLVKRQDIKNIINTVGPIISTSVNFHKSEPLKTKIDLENFNKDIVVFFDKELNASPSRIYDSINKKYIR
ncbi:Sua5/YciO/YrdC/YwlC family protein [Mycoplasma cottewii]|uniref:L-threonylcarbamoyladenylate synthase n=1 Tax=Mycoplasma cottewii TaxID=51364 RepID=A0ABY5TY72_9MOLU|nr:Sua5/YciO/YrdC/YwlC family protein [Mycoplasma cottewii]UWD34981.1 Sua5/YciO/YrdC/YwlC family protein [Mycoplasma cottewii]